MENRTLTSSHVNETKDALDSLELFNVEDVLYPPGYRLLPGVRQKYEYELAMAEASALSEEEIIERGAYFESVSGELTNHFQICDVVPSQVNPEASKGRKRFFEVNKFSVGYATHGLFPYRGKFHPQMIKALMNVIGLKPGHVVMDPMMGSGTTLVEAAIMGIDSVGYDWNPFCVAMTEAKLAGLDMDCSEFNELFINSPAIFSAFEKKRPRQRRLDETGVEPGRETDAPETQGLEAEGGLRKLLTLCYLDTLAYAQRRKTKTARELFPQLLRRYLDAVRAFDQVRARLGLRLGSWQVERKSATAVPLPNDAVDGIVFSPPYSFALDYLENDRIQLEYLGYNLDEIRDRMVGLKGRTVKEKLSLYYDDLKGILEECSRVLKPRRYCVIVIGSNTNQTGGERLEEGLIDLGAEVGIPLARHMVREIEGIRNTMLEEHILFLRKET